MHVVGHCEHTSNEDSKSSTVFSEHEACLLCTHYSQIFNELAEFSQFKFYHLVDDHILVLSQPSEFYYNTIECRKSRGPPEAIV
jgi:hypothetical protein